MKNKMDTFKANWFVWLFPLIALGISGWLFINYLNQQGPTIKISFEDGASIQAEKTRVRFRGVTIGVVKKITISEDTKQVIAHVVLQRDAENFAVAGSKFWLVLPKVNFQGVSGLETLFEGTYIAVQPGNSDGEFKKDFKGRIGSDSNESLEDTSSYTLETDNVGSINSGDSVSFRGLTIGSVTKVTLSKTAQTLLVQINIQNKYTKLVRVNTVFWRKVGIQANVGLFGAEVKMNSLESFLHGGIDMFSPDAPGEVAKSQHKFILYASPPKGYEKWNPKLE